MHYQEDIHDNASFKMRFLKFKLGHNHCLITLGILSNLCVLLLAFAFQHIYHIHGFLLISKIAYSPKKLIFVNCQILIHTKFVNLVIYFIYIIKIFNYLIHLIL